MFGEPVLILVFPLRFINMKMIMGSWENRRTVSRFFMYCICLSLCRKTWSTKALDAFARPGPETSDILLAS